MSIPASLILCSSPCVSRWHILGYREAWVWKGTGDIEVQQQTLKYQHTHIPWPWLARYFSANWFIAMLMFNRKHLHSAYKLMFAKFQFVKLWQQRVKCCLKWNNHVHNCEAGKGICRVSLWVMLMKKFRVYEKHQCEMAHCNIEVEKETLTCQHTHMHISWPGYARSFSAKWHNLQHWCSMCITHWRFNVQVGMLEVLFWKMWW